MSQPRVRMDHALIAFQENLESISPKEWLVAHTSFMLPLHKYRGEAYLLEDRLLFKGYHKDTHKPYALTIPFSSIIEVYQGFDDVYKRRSDRGLGLQSAPLRITYHENNIQRRLYAWIGFKRLSRTSKNRAWSNALTETLRRGKQ
ncbi:MAG: hypothetical protein ACE5PO_01000 [Candidatus Bathyarchaeia archaeon]